MRPAGGGRPRHPRGERSPARAAPDPDLTVRSPTGSVEKWDATRSIPRFGARSRSSPSVAQRPDHRGGQRAARSWARGGPRSRRGLRPAQQPVLRAGRPGRPRHPHAREAWSRPSRTPAFTSKWSTAVTTKVLENFDRALGRRVTFRGRPLLLVPHAFRGANAFYDPDLKIASTAARLMPVSVASCLRSTS
jgi:hypothetical protein